MSLFFPSMRKRVQAVWSQTLWVQVALSLAIFGLALAVRLPNLMMVPAYTDESREVLWGLDIALGRHFPLTGIDSYDGPLFAYLVAGLFHLLGVSAEIPREMALICGALTVVAVYWLGRLMLNRWAGLIAAGLAMGCPQFVIYTSHPGWSSSLSPFFVMATAVALYAGVERDKPWLLASSGLLAALTLQSHPTSLTSLIGMLLWFLTRPTLRQSLGRPAPYIALGLFLIGYSPMILANVGFGAPVLSDAVHRTYAFVPTLDPLEYLRRLTDLVRIAGFYVGGGIGDGTTTMRVVASIMLILLLIGFVVAWRRQNRLIPSIFFAALFLLPFLVVSPSYRYSPYFIPMSYVVLGILAEGAIRFLWNKRGDTGVFRILRRPALAFCVIILVGFAAYSLYNLFTFYQDAFADGMTNEDYFRLVEDVKNNGACGSNLFVEKPAASTYESPDGGFSPFAYNNVDFVLTMSSCAHTTLNPGVILQKLSNEGQSGWLIAPANYIQDNGEALNLWPISTIHPVVFATITPISLYRVQAVRR